MQVHVSRAVHPLQVDRYDELFQKKVADVKVPVQLRSMPVSLQLQILRLEVLVPYAVRSNSPEQFRDLFWTANAGKWSRETNWPYMETLSI